MTDIQKLLKEFAQFVGEQQKNLKDSLKQDVSVTKTEVLSGIDTKLRDLKDELIGGASEELDTFKELADELNKLKASGDSAPEALLGKLTTLSSKVEALESALGSVTGEQLKDAFNQGYNG